MRAATHLGWHPPTVQAIDDARTAATLRALTEQRLASLHHAKSALARARRGEEGVWALQAYVQAGHRAAELLRAQSLCTDARGVLEACFEAAVEALEDVSAPHELRLFAIEAVRWSTAELVGIDRDHGDLPGADRVAARARTALCRFRDCQVHA